MSFILYYNVTKSFCAHKEKTTYEINRKWLIFKSG